MGQTRPGWLLCAGFCVLTSLTAVPARADRILLRNGRTLDGDITAETDKTVTLDITGADATHTLRLSKAQIESYERVPREGPPYVVIPLFGTIGDDVTLEALRAGLAEARAARPRYVVLAINSPGGNVTEMRGMLALLAEASKDLEIIAYVKSGYSAAAVIAMSCRQVFMTPDAAMGAAVPYRMTDNGPTDVDAKFRSVIEAEMRAAAARGGHDDLLIRGMIELDLEIFLAADKGRPVLRTTGPGRVVKAKGQILTLTAAEAADCGLARVAADMGDLGKQVAGGAWHQATRRTMTAVTGTVAKERRRRREEAERRQRVLARLEALERVRPEWDAIERRVAEVTARGLAAKSAIADLTAKRDAELQQIDREYRNALELARYQLDPNAAVARAVEVMNARAASTRQYTQSQVSRLEADSEAALLESSQLRIRQRQLLASVPAD